MFIGYSFSENRGLLIISRNRFFKSVADEGLLVLPLNMGAVQGPFQSLCMGFLVSKECCVVQSKDPAGVSIGRRAQ